MKIRIHLKFKRTDDFYRPANAFTQIWMTTALTDLKIPGILTVEEFYDLQKLSVNNLTVEVVE